MSHKVKFTSVRALMFERMKEYILSTVVKNENEFISRIKVKAVRKKNN